MADIRLIIDVDDDGKIKKTSDKLDDLGTAAKKTGGKADELGGSFAPGSDLLKGTFNFGEATGDATNELGMMFEQLAGGSDPLDSFIGMVAGLGGALGPIGAVAIPAITAGLVALTPYILQHTDLFRSFEEVVGKAGEALDNSVEALSSWKTALQDELGPEITDFSRTVLQKELIDSSKEATKVMDKMGGQFESLLKKMSFQSKDVFGTDEDRERMEALADAVERIEGLGDIDTSNVDQLKDTLEVVTFILEEGMGGALNMNEKQMDNLVEYGRKLQEMIEEIGDDQEDLTRALDRNVDQVQSIGQGSGTTYAQPFADGGVVNRATPFMQTNGTMGIMGEAGPEAILPLKRGADGKLGVHMSGSGSSPVVVHQTFNFSANGDDSVKKIIASEAPKIAKITEQSIINSRQRGGSIRKVFG